MKTFLQAKIMEISRCISVKKFHKLTQIISKSFCCLSFSYLINCTQIVDMLTLKYQNITYFKVYFQNYTECWKK